MKKIGILSIVLACVQCFVWSEASADNEVTILHEGYVIPIEGRQLVPGVDEENGGRYVASTIALVKGTDAQGKRVYIVVDPGFVGKRRWLLKALRKAGVHRKEVTHVFLSHHHPDHTINAALFPKATVVDFWATYKNDLWEDHADEYEIAPGIEVRRTPGHTNEDASLIVDTEHGTVVFTHVWWLRTEQGILFPPEADPIGEAHPNDLHALENSRAFVLETADCIVPGHGSAFANPLKEGAICDFDDD